MRVHKRASKRVSTKQREKVKRKVREHKRKSRRDSKKDVTWKSRKRQDPGIPNSFPYKEQLLNEIEQKRLAAEQQKLQEKEARLNGKNSSNADKEEDDIEQDDEIADVAEESESEEADMQDAEDDDEEQVSSSLFDGSLKALLEKSNDSNVAKIIFALDARDPLSWRVPCVEDVCRSKKLDVTYVLTKADLVPREPLCAWLGHLSQSHPTYAVSVSTQGAGLETLAKHIKPKQTKQAVAVLGLQNSGRSSLANALAELLPDNSVFDTPALVSATARNAHPEDAEEEQEHDGDAVQAEQEDDTERDRRAAHRVLMRNAGGIFKVHEPLPLIEALMHRTANTSDLMMAYTTPAFVDTQDFLVGVARASGRLRKGAVPDTIAAARTVLHQWSNGQTGYYAAAPSPLTDDTQEQQAYKQRTADARKALEQDDSLTNVVLPRKVWRQHWPGKELRLTSSFDADLSQGMLGEGNAAFTHQVESDEEDDEEVEEELEADEDEDDVEFDDEEEDDEDEEDDEED